MQKHVLLFLAALMICAEIAVSPIWAQQTPIGPMTEGDFLVKNFKFRSGETLPEIRFHYTTLGKPNRDSEGRIINAVLLLHDTGATGQQFLQPQFSNELFGAGQLLDVSRFYVILPDSIGHGKSSKPSDGLHSHFPKYDYEDMVAGHYSLLAGHLEVGHLRLVLGMSMGCMQTFIWGEIYKDFMDALMPIACLPQQIAGRNRVWRKMAMDAIREDPEWKDGEYTDEPQRGLHTALDFLLLSGSAPLPMQKTLPTREAADEYLSRYQRENASKVDANDLFFQLNASSDYDASPGLERIRAPLMHVNSADDFDNPPELGIAEREIKRVKKGKFVLLPAGDQTQGHSTLNEAVQWKEYLGELLTESERPKAASRPKH